MNYRTRTTRRGPTFLTWASLFLLMAALVLAILQLISYSRERTRFPSGLSIAGVPVGGLDRQQAANRLLPPVHGDSTGVRGAAWLGRSGGRG